MILEAREEEEEEKKKGEWRRMGRGAFGFGRSVVGEALLLAPSNFGMVDRGIYRCGFPALHNLPFLDSLGLRSVVYLCQEPYPDVNAEFVRPRGIRLFQFGIEGSKFYHVVSGYDCSTEYIAVTTATCQAIWMRRILTDLKYEQKDPTVIYCDNQSTIAMAKNPVHHNRTKHIELRHHFIREQIANGQVELIHCSTEEQMADIFTKPLPLEKFIFCREKIGVKNISIMGEC